MPAFTALFDACVLHPAPLRDLLMELAGTGLFRARWTNQIHEEWIASVVRSCNANRARLERTRQLMDQTVLDCLVEGYEPLIEGLEMPDPDDRHVLAAAICGRADVIVTSNLKDFPQALLAGYGIEAQHPDVFLEHLASLNPIAFCMAVRKQRARLKNPPKTVDDFLATPVFSTLRRTRQFLEEHRDSI